MKIAVLAVCISLCCVVIRGNAADAGSYGPVQPKETLYRIALKYQQPGVTVSQAMMSIFAANPDAFDDGNINRLRLGSVLRIPDAEIMAKLDREQAYRDATAQIDAYEQELRQMQTGQAAPQPQLPAPPVPVPVVEAPAAAAADAPDLQQIDELKQGLAADEQQVALPEPKTSKARKQEEESAPLFRFSYDLSLINDDNVRLAQDNDDVRSDVIYSATVKAIGGKSLDSFSIWNYGGSASYNKFDTYDKLDNYDFEVNTRYRFALSSGFTAPIYSLRAKIGGREYDSEMRDATFYGVSADLNKWLTTSINMTTGIGYNGQESKSEVFDTQETFIFINFDTNFSKKDLVYTTFSYISGDVVSSSKPSLDVIEAADAIEPDDAFGGVDANQFAYRIDSDTLVFTLGYNRILTPDVSIDLSARYVESEAKSDSSLSYERTIWRASLLGRF